MGGNGVSGSMFLGLCFSPSLFPKSSFLGFPAGAGSVDPELLDLSFLSLLDLGASSLLLVLGAGDASSIRALWANLESAIFQSGRGLCCDARRLVVGRVRLF